LTGGTGGVGLTGASGVPGSAPIPTTNAIGNTSYTLVLGDANNEVDFALVSTTRAVTVPPNSSVAFPIGTKIYIIHTTGNVALNLTAGAGVTIRGMFAISVQTSCTIWKIATDTWLSF
jgi:hypothetical protein